MNDMDNKASIKISFEVYGSKFRQEWWVNFFPDETVDEIATWLKESFDIAKARHELQILEVNRAKGETNDK